MNEKYQITVSFDTDSEATAKAMKDEITSNLEDAAHRLDGHHECAKGVDRFSVEMFDRASCKKAVEAHKDIRSDNELPSMTDATKDLCMYLAGGLENCQMYVPKELQNLVHAALDDGNSQMLILAKRSLETWREIEQMNVDLPL